MPSFNRVILIGRLTRDPELRYTAGGLAIAKFRIAVDRRFKNQQGERVTDFFDCSAFRQTAEFVTNYVAKGRLVAIDGRIELNESTGQDGQKRYFTNIICDTVETLDAQRDAAAEGGAPPMAAGAPNMGAPAGGMGGGGGAPGRGQAPAPAAAGDDNGYYPDEDAAPPPPPRARPSPAAALSNAGLGDSASGYRGGGRGDGGGAPAAPARGAGAGAGGGRPQAAPAPAYPDDDFDDSDPFADQ